MAYRFKNRRFDAAGWVTNPLLAHGEIGLLLDAGGEPIELRIGNGVDDYASLPIFAVPGGGAGAVASVAGKTGVVTLVKADVGLPQVDDVSDANKPVSTAQGIAIGLRILLTEKGAALGVATLDADSKIPVGQIPSIAVIDFLGTVVDQTAMLALVGQKGDWCIRSDDGKVYVITGSDPSVIGGWTALSYPGAVTSTDGLAEGVTNKYFTESRVRASLLTGVSFGSSAAIVAGDSLLVGIGKLQAQVSLKADFLAATDIAAGAVAVTRAAHLNRDLDCAGTTNAAFAATGTSGALKGDLFKCLVGAAGAFTAAGAITAPAGMKLTAGPGEIFLAVYNAATDAFYSATPVVPVLSVTAGTGVTLGGTATNPIINSAGGGAVILTTGDGGTASTVQTATLLDGGTA